VCGRPTFHFGWHADLWDASPNKKAGWYAACVIAWELWNAPSAFVRILKQLQGRRCDESGKRLRRTAEVDHRVPLNGVWRKHRDADWPLLALRREVRERSRRPARQNSGGTGYRRKRKRFVTTREDS
jgi:hypothetical protein